MKKLFSLLFAALLAVYAAPVSASPLPVDLGGAAAAMLVCAETGDVILESHADEPIEAAGLRRLPALLAVCRAFDEGRIADETEVTVSPGAAGVRGATAFLAPNEKIKAGLLLKAAVMLTAGDAVCALLEAIYPSEAAALEGVNAELTRVGASPMEGSPLGEGHAFTLRELSAVCLELAGSESCLRYSSVYLDSLPHENASATELTNPNRLVRHYSGCFGIATGSVGASDYAAAAIATRGSTTYLALVCGMDDSASRFEVTRALLDHGFSAYRAGVLYKKGETAASIPVRGGTAGEVSLSPERDAAVLVPTGDPKTVSEFDLPGSVEAPVSAGDVLGRLIIKDASGTVIAEAPLVAQNDIASAGFGLWFIRLIRGWLRADG